MALFCVVSPTLAGNEIQLIEQIVAKVNGEIITRGELDKGRKLYEEQLKNDKVPPAQIREMVKQKRSEILSDQIDNLLLVQKAKEMNINVNSDEAKYFASVQRRYKITDPDQFRAFVEKESGTPYEDMRLLIRNKMMADRVVQQEVGAKMNISRQELTRYYEEHRDEFVRDEQVFLREIVISLEGKNPSEAPTAQQRARAILDRISKGEKFPELARELSEGRSAENFGEVGWVRKEEIRPELRDLFAQRRGYVTDVMKLDANLMIFKVEERHESGLAAFEDVEQEIMGKVLEPRMQPKRREYLTKLRQDAFLEIREGYLEAYPASGKDTTWKDPAKLTPESTSKEEVRSRLNSRRRLLWLIPARKHESRSSQPGV